MFCCISLPTDRWSTASNNRLSVAKYLISSAGLIMCTQVCYYASHYIPATLAVDTHEDFALSLLRINVLTLAERRSSPSNGKSLGDCLNQIYGGWLSATLLESVTAALQPTRWLIIHEPHGGHDKRVYREGRRQRGERLRKERLPEVKMTAQVWRHLEKIGEKEVLEDMEGQGRR